MEEIDDDEIALHLWSGGAAGQWQLLQKYGPRALGALAKEYPWLTEEDREHVLERALDKALRSSGTYDDKKGPIGPWFVKVALNMAIDMLRTGKLGLKDEADVSALVEEGKKPVAEYVADGDSQLMADLLEAIEGLPEGQKRVAIADLLDGRGCAETADLAERLGIGKSAVRVSRMRYREALQKALRKKGYKGNERRVPR